MRSPAPPSLPDHRQVRRTIVVLGEELFWPPNAARPPFDLSLAALDALTPVSHIGGSTKQHLSVLGFQDLWRDSGRPRVYGNETTLLLRLLMNFVDEQEVDLGACRDAYRARTELDFGTYQEPRFEGVAE
ncbi:MAG: hypothetical protein WBN29_05290 [Polyangiales bacterium]